MIDYSGVPTEQLIFMMKHNYQQQAYFEQLADEWRKRMMEMWQVLQSRHRDGEALETYRDEQDHSGDVAGEG